uniref:Uncharacterized protein n=1 Tax=Rhizophora mucronata TaxID=61149 RepID=A0A2P2QWH3_RHIMU
MLCDSLTEITVLLSPHKWALSMNSCAKLEAVARAIAQRTQEELFQEGSKILLFSMASQSLSLPNVPVAIEEICEYRRSNRQKREQFWRNKGICAKREKGKRKPVS